MIRLSDKYGANPSINVCPFCGEDKELLLLGRLKGDVKAPQRVITNYEPCDKCKERMSKGVTLIEVTTADTGALPIQEGTWPTGRWSVMDSAAARALFSTDKKKLLVDEGIYSMIVDKQNS